MAKRHEPTKQSLVREVEHKTDIRLGIAALVTLVLVLVIRGWYGVEAVPDFVLWFLCAAVSKDAIKLIKDSIK